MINKIAVVVFELKTSQNFAKNAKIFKFRSFQGFTLIVGSL